MIKAVIAAIVSVGFVTYAAYVPSGVMLVTTMAEDAHDQRVRVSECMDEAKSQGLGSGAGRKVQQCVSERGERSPLER